MTLPYLFLLLLFSGAIRFLYYQHAPGVIVSEDTYSYFLAGEKMLQRGILVDDFRTPFYPLFLHLFTFLSGNFGAPILSPQFFSAMNYVLLAQSVFGLFSLLFFYLSLRTLGVKVLPAFFFSLFLGFDILVFSWERLLLTESLSVFFLAALFYFLIKALYQPKTLYFFLLFLFFLSATFLRPIFVALPFPLFLILFLHQKTKKVLFFSFLSLFLYSGLLFLYSRENFRVYHVRGLTRATDLLFLGKILKFDLPIEGAKEEKFFYEAVSQYRKLGREKDPFRFLEHFNLIGEEKLPLLWPLGDFNRKVLAQNFFSYFWLSAKQIPQALLETSEKIILREKKESFGSFFFQTLFWFYRNFQIFTLFLLFLIPFTFWQFLRLTSSFPRAVLALLATFSLYQIIFAVFLGYGEFGRLLTPAQPLFFLFLFLSLFPSWKKNFF